MPTNPTSTSARRGRALIVNADDLGYTVGVNRAIVRCAQEGILTSATLMANGPAFDDAVEHVRECPGLGVGVHLVLTELAPVAPPEELAGLVAGDGLLPASMGDLAARVLGGRASLEVLTAELDRQVSKVVAAGIAPTHLDTHKHVHVLPKVLDAVAEVARRHGIRWIRRPFECRAGFGLARIVAREGRLKALKQEFSARAVSAVRPSFERRLRGAGLRAPDTFVGVALTGLWSEAAAAEVVKRLPPGLTEWMVHPGNCDEDLLGRPTRLRSQREGERDILLLPELRRLVEAEGIELTNFREVSE